MMNTLKLSLAQVLNVFLMYCSNLKFMLKVVS